jgi:hypothetical protein
VRIGLVAIRAVRKRQRLFEIAIQVTFRAADLGMFSEKRILGFRMVEFKAGQKFLPARGGVTFLAALLERAFVRIDVAIDAGRELHVSVARRAAGHIGLVALFASDLAMKARQRVAGLGVIELVCRFPVREIVALQAVVSQLAFVNVLVARLAILGQPKKGFRKILHLDERALGGDHVGSRVTFFAGYAGMLPFQLVAGETMIKLFLRGLPVDEAEVFTVMVKMTADAILAIRIRHLELRMIAMFSDEPLRDFFVAIQALKRRNAGAELVATRALRRAA